MRVLLRSLVLLEVVVLLSSLPLVVTLLLADAIIILCKTVNLGVKVGVCSFTQLSTALDLVALLRNELDFLDRIGKALKGLLLSPEFLKPRVQT